VWTSEYVYHLLDTSRGGTIQRYDKVPLHKGTEKKRRENTNTYLPQSLCFRFGDSKKRNENLILLLFCLVTIKYNLLGEYLKTIVPMVLQKII
jgi:hypothetical protein